MQIAEIIEKTEVEGPGIRTGLWLQGCTINCSSCCNQSFLPVNGGTFWNEEELAVNLASLDTEGITILGGEPLQQAKQLIIFLKHFKSISNKGVMLFTGYTWETIEKSVLFKSVVSLCDLVIAGPFIETLSPDIRRWIGSTNQTIHFITDYYSFLEPWPVFRKEIEFHLRDNEIIVNGTPLEIGFI